MYFSPPGSLRSLPLILILSAYIGEARSSKPETNTLYPNQTIDTNSPFFARFCFSIGVQLKRVEVIADDEAEIMEAVKRMSDNYDLVVTSGGIGPTSVPHGAYIP